MRYYNVFYVGVENGAEVRGCYMIRAADEFNAKEIAVARMQDIVSNLQIPFVEACYNKVA